jgi:hypothetical protein
MVNYARLNKISIIVFAVLAVMAVCISVFYKMYTEALILWLLNFIVAFIAAVFGSLRIRSEEEEKMLK